MNSKSREHLLNQLINLEGNLDELSNKLKMFSWDENESLIVLSINTVNLVLNKFLNGKINLQELEKWADLIECRNDIDFDVTSELKIKTILNTLANPDIYDHVSPDTIKNWITEQP